MTTVEEVRRRYGRGEELRFVFFWGHSAKPGTVTKACLSQWYPCDFSVDGARYRSAEQYMMAGKALLFGDEAVYGQIMAADDPGECKALGRKIRGFDQKVWDGEKLAIVVRGNLAKFSQNAPLREYLLGTGEDILVEASPYDGIWGVGLAMDDGAICDPRNWKGQNLLGCALMEARRLLREGTREGR